jgi:hypothetical protein
MTATPKFFFVHPLPGAVFAIAENAHFTPPFAIAMEAAWRVIFQWRTAARQVALCE